MNIDQIQTIMQHEGDPLAILQSLGGYYECPKDQSGKRIGQLVGYAGKYDTNSGKKQFVGEIYANFSIAEQYPTIMLSFADSLIAHIPEVILEEITIVCGPQIGGFAIGTLCALSKKWRLAYIEKVIQQLATETLREQSRLDFLRHSVIEGDKVLLTEDVLNNFSTTKEAIALIESLGAEVVCIAGLLNRSDNTEKYYHYGDRSVPVVSLVRKRIEQWKQDDPAVQYDISIGNVVLKPKNEWGTLMNAIERVKY